MFSKNKILKITLSWYTKLEGLKIEPRSKKLTILQTPAWTNNGNNMVRNKDKEKAITMEKYDLYVRS